MQVKILTPIVTIFNDNNTIDYSGNKKIIEFLIENGIDGLVPLGSTGEFPDLDFETKKEYLKFFLETVNKRVEVLAGTGSLNYEETIELSNYALELGADGVLIILPYYFGMSQNEAYRYYDKLAKDIEGDVYIYNFEARTGFDISKDTLRKLVENNDNIVGMKDSTSSIAHTKECILEVKKVNKNFKMYSGFDDHFIPNVLCGGSGCIAALSNFIPDIWANWIKAVKEKDIEKIKYISDDIDKLMEVYSYKSNFAVLFKKLINERELDINETTLFPFDNIEENDFQKAKKILLEVLSKED